MLTSEFVPSRTNPDQIPHLVVIPEISFCEKIQKVTYILGESAELWFTNSTDNIIYTYCLYNEAEFRYEFWYDDELIAWVKSDGYRFSDDRGLNIFRLATVCFHPNGRTYDYTRADDRGGRTALRDRFRVQIFSCLQGKEKQKSLMLLHKAFGLFCFFLSRSVH